jgi:hypothetical protein
VRVALTAAFLATLAFVGPAAAATTVTDRLIGTEIVPFSSTRGTFVGVATGQLPAAWRVQIVHEPLAKGPTVAITGGRFVLVTRSGEVVGGSVTTGTVTVRQRGSHCTDQTYAVSATFSKGSFDGTLTHHRRSVFGRCVVVGATLAGRGVFTL